MTWEEGAGATATNAASLNKSVTASCRKKLKYFGINRISATTRLESALVFSTSGIPVRRGGRTISLD